MWASWHAQNGTPLDVLRKLGAWGSLQMVDRYAHLSPGYLAQYANNAHGGHNFGHKKNRKSSSSGVKPV